MRKKFKRDINSLTEIFIFLDEFVAHHKLDESISFVLQLAVEEIFTNMVKYDVQNPSDIDISLAQDADQVVIELFNPDAESFDIHQAKEYDPSLPLNKREPGGVGIHLVKKFINKIEYDYKDGISKITLIKYLEKPHV
ncbi:ATP-binding protein [candidate division KSB1 bacterium]|nr:ATP-binding protein [candidate division KSB1 bacterium]RQV99734.1 MAG: ATP-binding protein [candidate division KSB1 bacterium]